MKKTILAMLSRLLDFGDWLNRELLVDGKITKEENAENAAEIAKRRAAIFEREDQP